MNRKQFVSECAAAICVAGLCCASKPSKASPEPDSAACSEKELQNVSNRADAARLRFSKLIEILETRLPEQERKEILHALGGKCADTYRADLIDRYKGNIKDFLEEGRRQWMAEADYDESEGTIRL